MAETAKKWRSSILRCLLVPWTLLRLVEEEVDDGERAAEEGTCVGIEGEGTGEDGWMGAPLTVRAGAGEGEGEEGWCVPAGDRDGDDVQRGRTRATRRGDAGLEHGYGHGHGNWHCGVDNWEHYEAHGGRRGVELQD